MANVFHDLGKVTASGIKNLIASIKTANNVWSGINTFKTKVDIGTDESIENGASLTVGTENTKQELSVHGKIKQDNQAIGTYYDFIQGLGQIRANLFPQATNATLPTDPRIGEVWFNTEEVAIVVWDGSEWVPIGGGPKTRFLTVQAGFGGAATNDPAGVIHDTDSNVQIIATPDFGFTFDHWSGVDEDYISAVNEPIAYVTMAKSFIATANFKVRQYLLTITPDPNGVAIAVSGDTEFDFGSLAEITATPNVGYDFANWSGGTFGDQLSATTTVLIQGDTTVKANFSIKTYFLEVISGTGGVASGSGTYDHATQAQITSAPDVGYEFTGWSGIGVADPTLESTTVDMVAERSVTANFALKNYLLTVTAGEGGTATGGGNFDHFTQAPIEAVPDDANGYEFKDWTGDGVASTTSATTTVDMVMERSVTANFKLKDYTLSVTSGSGGTAESLDEKYPNYQHGDVATIEATPDDIHDFDVWTGDEVGDLSSASTSVLMVTSKIVTATFKLKQYLLTVNAGNGGNALGGGTFEHFTQATVTATPDDSAGYEFDYWSGENLVDANINPTTVNMIGASTVTANFKLKDYGLTVLAYSLSAGAAGGGTTSGGGVTYQHGDLAPITATPDQIHDFVNWTGAVVTNANLDSTTVEMLGAVTVTANFQYKTYVLTVAAEIGGTATGSGTYAHFTEVDIEATPGNTPDGRPGYEFDYWAVTEGDSTITDTTVAASKAQVLGTSKLTAYFKLKEYTILTGAKFKGKIALDGYYPLYETANEANSDPDGDGSNHEHVINGVTYYMPNGLSTVYHGNYTIPWGSLELYDQINPDQGLWGTAYTSVTKTHGDQGGYKATPSQYHVFDSIIADSRYDSALFIDPTQSEGETIAAINNLNFIANFSLLQYKLYVIHAATNDALNAPNSTYEGYWGDIEVNGASNDFNVVLHSYTQGLTTDGVWTTSNVELRAHGGDFDAFSTQTIKAIPFTDQGYGFIEWIEPTGQNLVADREDAETDVIIRPEGDNTNNAVEVAARFGRLPISTFLVSGDLYFGSTIELTDISTAPSGDGKVVSAEYSTSNSSVTIDSRDTAVRTFRENYVNGSHIEVQSINGNSTYNYGDLTKPWAILVDMQEIQQHYALPVTVFERGGQSLNWNTYQTTAYLHDHVNYGSGSVGNLPSASNGIQYSSTTSSKVGPVGKLAVWSTGGSIHTATLNNGIKNISWYDSDTSSSTYNQYFQNPTSIPSTFNLSSPSSTGEKLRLFGSPSGSGLSWGYRHTMLAGLFQDIGFLNRALTTDEVNEWLTTNIGDLSFYAELEDHIECGTGTHPNLNGSKGKVVATLVNGTEGQFKSLGKITLPSGSPGDTTGSLDVTLTVTDDQGLTDTDTQTITFGPVPLEVGGTTYTQNVTTTDGLNLLANTSVLEVDVEVTDGSVTTQEDYL